MNDTNIGSQGSQRQSTIGEVGAIPTQTKSSSTPQYTSTLSKSEQESTSVSQTAESPNLPVPNDEGSEGSSLVLLGASIQMSEIGTQVLQGWSASLEVEADLVKQYLNSSGYLSQQDELHKLQNGVGNANSVPATKNSVDGTSANSSTNKPLEGLDAAIAENDMAKRYLWMQSVGAVLDVAVSGTGNKEGTSVGTVGSVNSAGNSTGGLGIQGMQGVQDSQGNVVGLREDTIAEKIAKGIDPTSNIIPIPVTNSVDKSGESREKQKTGTAEFMGQSLLAAVSEIALFQVGAPIAGFALTSGMHAEAIVVRDMWVAVVQNPTEQTSLNAGWFSAMFSIGLVYQNSAEKANSYGGGGGANKEKAPDIAFAKTYAQNMLIGLSSPRFVASIEAAISKGTEKGNDSAKDISKLVAQSKIVLLSLSLALLAKLEVGSRADEGWINELDFAGLLNGATDVNQNDLFATADVKQSLIAEIKAQLATLSAPDRLQILNNLLDYMSTNPAVEKLLDQQTTFDLVLNPPSFEKELVGEVPV